MQHRFAVGNQRFGTTCRIHPIFNGQAVFKWTAGPVMRGRMGWIETSVSTFAT